MVQNRLSRPKIIVLVALLLFLLFYSASMFQGDSKKQDFEEAPRREDLGTMPSTEPMADPPPPPQRSPKLPPQKPVRPRPPPPPPLEPPPEPPPPNEPFLPPPPPTLLKNPNPNPNPEPEELAPIKPELKARPKPKVYPEPKNINPEPDHLPMPESIAKPSSNRKPEVNPEPNLYANPLPDLNPAADRTHRTPTAELKPKSIPAPKDEPDNFIEVGPPPKPKPAPLPLPLPSQSSSLHPDPNSESTLARCTPKLFASITFDNTDPNSTIADQKDPKVLTQLFQKFQLDRKVTGTALALKQPKEDPWRLSKESQATVIDNLLKHKEHGFFLEVGALDGETSSSTLALELQRSWTGLLVESDSKQYAKLEAVNRDVFSTSSCISTTAGLQLPNAPRGAEDVEESSQDVSNACFPLGIMLDAINVSCVDYFSFNLDTGTLPILQALPFDRIRFRTLTIKASADQRDAVSAYLATQCFDVVPVELVEDVVYINRNDRIDLGYEDSYPV